MKRKNPLSRQDDLHAALINVEEVGPHPKNSRHHSEANLQAIMSSLQKFGQRSPIVVNPDSMHIVKGNGTWESAVRLGWKQIKCVYHRFKSEADEVAYMVADNKTNDLSEFNFQHLAENLKELSAANYDVTITGFTEQEASPLIKAKYWSPDDVKGSKPSVEEVEHPAITKAIKLWLRKNGDVDEDYNPLIGICRHYLRTWSHE
jgi:hypothetical protein